MGAILESPCLSVRPSVCPSVCPSVRSHFRNRYLSFYWMKWFYIWYMALAWWLVLCLSFPGLPHIYFLFTVRLTNEWVGVFLAWRSVQHLVVKANKNDMCKMNYSRLDKHDAWHSKLEITNALLKSSLGRLIFSSRKLPLFLVAFLFGLIGLKMNDI